VLRAEFGEFGTQLLYGRLGLGACVLGCLLGSLGACLCGPGRGGFRLGGLDCGVGLSA